MSFVAFLPLILSLALYFVPVWLLRPKDEAGRHARFAVARSASPATIRNACIAHGLRFAVFGPFFVLGAQGDFWPVLIAAAGLGAGLLMLHALRQPILEFLAGALKEHGSITVHAFIAHLHGDDRRVRVLAASLTLLALTALMAGECFALAAFLQLALGNDIAARAITFAALLLGMLYAFPAGHAGTLQSAQLQLAMLFFALFATTALLIYSHVTELTALPSQAMFAMLLIAGYGVALMIYRSSRYLDTGPVSAARSARWLSLFGKILNPLVSAFVVLAVVLALMEFFAAGPSIVAAASSQALKTDTGLPVIALMALALLPLFQPLADVSHWQSLAALEAGGKDGSKRREAGLRALFRLYAAESALLWLFMAAFGAIAMAAAAVPGDAKALQSFVQALTAGDNPLGGLALSILLVAVFALALPAISAAFSAGLCTIGYDLRPAEKSERAAPRLFFLAVIVALGLADVAVQLDFTSTTFLALVFALASPVLAFAPLILGPAVAGRTVSADAALAVLGAGAASCLGFLGVFALSGKEIYLWTAVPASLGLSSIVFAIAARGQGSRMR